MWRWALHQLLVIANAALVCMLGGAGRGVASWHHNAQPM